MTNRYDVADAPDDSRLPFSLQAVCAVPDRRTSQKPKKSELKFRVSEKLRVSDVACRVRGGHW